MLVLDTSAAIAAVVGHPINPRLLERLGDDGDLHAPHLLDVETLHVLRRLVRTGQTTPERAAQAREDLDALRVLRYPHAGLLDRMWALRENLTAYDAAFVALSETLGVPLVTADRRLAVAPGHRATIEVF